MIRIERLRKRWPGFALAIDEIEIAAGEYFVVLGPSGAGKTVLLSCLAGLVRPDAGRICFDERDVTDLPPERRGVGWVSQSDTLFPHLTVEENIGFGRRYCRANREQFDRRVEHLIDLLELGPLVERPPADLSGGEVQRAMLARALAIEPRVLLLDEPLRGLDPTTHERLCDELARLHRELETTTFHITHDHIEARALADRIAVVQHGRMEQVGAAEEVFERPATCFVAQFTGAENVFALAGTGAKKDQDDFSTIDRNLLPPVALADGATHIAVRPEHVEVRIEGSKAAAAPPDALRLNGVIESLGKHGGWLRVHVRCGELRWTALVHPRDAARSDLKPQSDAILTVSPEFVVSIGEPAR